MSTAPIATTAASAGLCLPHPAPRARADEVQQLGGRVLVHCMTGLSRSPTVVIYYLMRRNSWRLRWVLAGGLAGAV